MNLVTKPEQRWRVITVKRLLKNSLTYKNMKKQVSVKKQRWLEIFHHLLIF